MVTESKTTGLTKLIFEYDDVKFEVSTVAHGRPESFLVRIPMDIVFPSGERMRSGIVYDIQKARMNTLAIEYAAMMVQFPTEYAKMKKDETAYHAAWNERRKEISEVVKDMFQLGMLRRQYV